MISVSPHGLRAKRSGGQKGAEDVLRGAQILFQFWSTEQVKLFTRKRAEQTLHISPVLISEGLTSVCEAVRAGPGGGGASGLDDEGRPAFRTTRARPAAVDRERLAGARRLSRSRPIADARAHLH